MATQGCLLLMWLALGVALGPHNRNCFTTNCGHGDSLTACIAGNWQCHHGEVCFMNVKHDSTVSMICVPANHAHCPHANHHQDASCAPLVYPPQHDCVYCCDTEHCVRNIEAAPAASITTAAPAVTAATPAPTTATPAPTTAPTMLPATTTPTPAPTTLVCMDNLPNNACSLLMSSCAELSVTEVCRKTCGVCGSSSVHTTAATASPPQTVATASPVLTAAATTSPPTAAAATTTTPVTQCLQCGDFDNSIPCTQDELLRAQDEPCPPGLHYCMTDAYKISADSSLTLYKRCVDELTCIKEFYLPYMQNTYCQHLDPMNIPDILACHLCCQGDACNSSLIPNATSLYYPSE